MTPPRPAHYLDWNATAPLRPQARAAMLAVLDAPGNPSSVHGAGRKARDGIERARAEVAALIGAATERLVFTGGGTEANALGLAALSVGIDALLVSAIEHDAVMQTARAGSVPVEVWPVTADGVADLAWLAARLRRGDRVAAALMLANNETGVIQPVAEAAALLHGAGGRLHVDAVQAAGKIPVDLTALGADTLALSAHKLGGPQGAGALAFASGIRPTPLWRGGGQEQGLRPGTENVAAIAGFGAAAQAAQAELANAAAQAAWRDAAAARLKAAGARIIGEAVPRLPNTLCLAVPGWPSERQVMWLDLGGVQVSAGAACSSGKVRPSPVLEAMGEGALAPSALRASGGYATDASQWSAFADLWLDGYARVSARQRTEVA